jgi:hypothetical protein
MSDEAQDKYAKFRALRFMESRIPALDALCVFIPEGTQPTGSVKETIARIGSMRWYPVPGGHRVLLPFEGGEYDHSRFTLEPKAWDHEHCDACDAHILAMTLCWVTESGPTFLLCESCHEEMSARGSRTST